MATRHARHRFRWSAMPTVLLAAALAIGAAAGLWAQTPAGKAAPNARQNADEAAIRATAEAYVKAFNAGDAKAVAASWTPDGEFIDESGREFRGRDAIAKEFAAGFAEHPGTTLDITPTSVKMLSPDVALETGTSRARSAEGAVGPLVKYTAIHVKRDGKWLVSNVSESRGVPDTSEPYLKELAWLVGDWKSDLGGKSVKFKCDWMAKKSFLIRTFTVSEQDKVVSSGTQIIGWDPVLQQIVSWTFESDGSFGREAWDVDGGRWSIDAASVLHDGSTSTARNIMTKTDENTFVWQSVDRSLNGELLPDTAEVKVKRVGR